MSKKVKSVFYKISLLSLLYASQACIANRDYQVKSYENRESIYDGFKRSDGKKIKVYLQNLDKQNLEKSLGYHIAVSKYCQSGSDIYRHDMHTWGKVEENIIVFGSNSKSPVAFICSPDGADFVYEYSYSRPDYRSGGRIIFENTTIVASIASFGVLPIVGRQNYEVSIRVKDAKNNLVKDFGTTKFEHTTFFSTALAPLILTRVIKRTAVEENVISEIIIDKVIESLPNLQR